MVDKALDQLILEMFGALVFSRNKLDITNVQHFGGGITINDRATTITNHRGYDELHMFAECGTHGQRCSIEWQGYVVPLPGNGVIRLLNTTCMVDWLTKDIPDGCALINQSLKLMYPQAQTECIQWHARFGLPPDFEWDSQQHLGQHDGFNYYEIQNRDFGHGGQYPLQMIVKSQTQLGAPNLLKVGNFNKMQSCCGGVGCNVCHPAILNTVPVMLTPGYPQGHPAIIANTNVVTFPSAAKMNPKSPKDVYEVLEFLEREIDVKIGMLSGQNILLHRVTLYDRENWEDKLRGELDLLRRRLGDKIGVIGDMRIVSLDEVDWPEGHPLSGSKPQTAVGRKFSVHAAYRSDYQAIKLTIMALVKA